MAYIVADRVKETTTVTGTGPATLAGAASGYRSFASQLSIGDTCAYVIVNSNGSEWETGIGTYSAVNTLTRTTIHASTNANAAVVFTAGVKDVFMGPTADSLVDYNPVTSAISNATWNGSTISTSKGGTGLTTIGTANQLLSVNSTATGLEYKTFTSNPGTVTSVSGTGTVNGLTLTGTVTSSGNLTLGGTLSNVNLASQITGTLPVANGGTGLTTLGTANQALSVNSAGTALEYHTVVGSVASADGSVTVSQTGQAVDLSVAVAAATTNVIVQVRNNTGATLTKGTVVYIDNAIGQIPTVAKAIATSDATSAQTLGMISADLANNSNGYVTIIGLISNINTSAYVDGDQLYLSGTTAGTFTKVKPYAPTHLVYVGIVEHAHVTQGKIFVKVQNGYEMDELHNVDAYNPSNGDLLIYNTSTNLWTHSPQSNLTVATSQITGTLPVANGGTGVTTSTGTGSVVLSNTPTLITPQTNAINAVPVVSGAGNNLTLTAGSGVTSGAGGSLILQAGVQATTGGDGKVVVKQVAGQTSNLQEWQNSSGTVLAKVSKDGFITSPVIYSQIGGGFFIPTELQGIYFENGTTQIKCNNGYIRFFNAGGSTGSIYIDPGSNGYTGYVSLDASNTFAQRNGTNAQTFRVYNTYTDASNYERLGITWASNVCTIGVAQAGTGVPRVLNVNANNINAPTLPTAATVTAATGNGTTVTYTAANTFSVGQVVSITGLTTTIGSSLNLSNQTITTASATQFTITNATVGTAAATQAGTATIQSAGNSVTITAGNGSGVGAGGNIILQPGAQGTSGGNGSVVIGASTTLKWSSTDYITSLNTGSMLFTIAGTGRLMLSYYSGYAQTTVAGALSFRPHNGNMFTNSGYVTYQTLEWGSLGVIKAWGGQFGTGLGASLAFPAYTQNIGSSFTVTNKSLTGNVATLTTSTPHRFIYGQTVTVSGVDATFDGTYTITSPSTTGSIATLTTFSYSKTAADVTSQAATGTATLVLNDLLLGASAFLRVSPSTAQTVTGIAATSTYEFAGTHVDGRMIRIYNVGTTNLTLAHNSTSSTAANRFWNSTGADIVLSTHQYVELIYDSTDNGRGGAGWRVSSVH